MRQIGPGALIGAASFFHSNSDESLVTAQTDSDATLCTLTMTALGQLQESASELLSGFQRYLLTYLSDRLASNLELLQATLHTDE